MRVGTAVFYNDCNILSEAKERSTSSQNRKGEGKRRRAGDGTKETSLTISGPCLKAMAEVQLNRDVTGGD